MKIEQLQLRVQQKLKKNEIYKRSDIRTLLSLSDLNLNRLTSAGVFKKIAHGYYYYPDTTIFGATAPEDFQIVKRVFQLRTFLLIAPTMYNSLGVGLTQQENIIYVYNEKKSKELSLGKRRFLLKKPARGFPNEICKEYLLVDLLNNHQRSGETQSTLLRKVTLAIHHFDHQRLFAIAKQFGHIKTQNILQKILQGVDNDLSS